MAANDDGKYSKNEGLLCYDLALVQEMLENEFQTKYQNGRFW